MYGAEYDSGDFAPCANDGEDLPCSADIAVAESGLVCKMLRARLLFYRYVFALNLLVFINVNDDNCLFR